MQDPTLLIILKQSIKAKSYYDFMHEKNSEQPNHKTN